MSNRLSSIDDTESLHEPKLLETLGIDEELWRSATPIKKKPTSSPSYRSHKPAPIPIPASYFTSLKNHTPTHSRQSSVNTTPYELISSPAGLRADESFISLNSGNEIKDKVQVTDKNSRYSVYVSNDDYEIPEQFQARRDEKTGKSSNWMNKFKKKGHNNSSSISNIFNIKGKNNNHRNTKSVSNIDD